MVLVGKDTHRHYLHLTEQARLQAHICCDITQHGWRMSPGGSVSHVTSLQQGQAQYAKIWWTNGREREAGQLEQSQGWKRVDCQEWPALPLGATVRSQPKLPLRAMSRSVAIQQQVSVLMSVALENMGISLAMAATGTTWMSRDSAELALPLTGCGTLES